MNPDPFSLSGPFRLNDRISPDGANDLDEVRRLDVALHARRGAAAPARIRPQSVVLDDLVHYQSLRGLKPDGAAAIDGPTALSLAADLVPDGLLQHAVHRLPLDAGVGAGEANRPGDVASARRGMALLGHYPPPLALDMLAPDPRLGPALQAFQTAHGLRPDGIMRPGGPTQLRAGQLLGAQMTGLIGPDPSRPAAFSPRPRVPVVRQVPGMPDARAVPVSPGVPAVTEEALHAVALSQAEAIRTRKATPADDGMSGGAGDDSLSGDEAGDTLVGAGGTADDNRAHLIARFGGADATRPWARGADEAQGDWFRRLDGAMRHAADATTRRQIVDDARAALPTEPTERLAAEQGVRPDAWLLAEEAPEAEQKAYADWLAVPADRRPPLPETMEMLWFAGPDGRLYRRSDAVVDPARRAGIMQVERLEAMVATGGEAAPSWEDRFAAAAESTMSMPPRLGDGAVDARARRGVATRRPRLETFAARTALPTPDAARTARQSLARAWIDERLKQVAAGIRHPRGETIRVGELNPTVMAFVRARGIDPKSTSIVLADAQLLHMTRDVKQKRGQSIPKTEIRNLARHIDYPKAVFWDDQDPALLYAFEIPNIPRIGKYIIRINIENYRHGNKKIENRVVSGGIVSSDDLNKRARYQRIQGDLE